MKATDPRFYSKTAADNQWIQKWSGMRWLMIDDINIRNTLQCKFQLNIQLRLSFFFSYWCILVQIIWASFVEWLRSFDSAVLRSRLPSHTTELWNNNRQCLRRSMSITMFCHGWQQWFSFPSRCNATFKREHSAFHWRSAGYLLNFFWWFSSILNFLFLIESYLKSNVLLLSHEDCQFLRVRFFRNWCNLSSILFVSWVVVDFCLFLG